MSEASYWQRGEALDYTNTTEKTIEAGTVIAFGDRIGVAGTDIAPGQTGSIHVEGVFLLPKGEGAISMGDEVCWEAALGQMERLAAPSANGTYNSTTTNRRIPAGYATQDADVGAAAVPVKINA